MLDAKDPAAIREIGSLEHRLPRSRMWLRPPYLYLVGFGEPLGIVDISDPARPRWAGEHRDLIPAPGKGFRLAGDRAFLVRREHPAEPADLTHPRSPASGQLYFDVLDLARDPAHPHRLGSVNLGVSAGGEYGSVTHHGNRAYVLVTRPHGEDPRSLLIIVDVRDPKAPSIERRLHLPAGKRYRNAEVRGDLLYLLQWGRQEARENGLSIFRMLPKGEPEFLGEATHTMLRYGMDLIVRGDVVYATFKGAPTFATFDVSNPRRPRIVHTHIENENWAGGLGLALDGDRLYVSGDNGPSAVFDVAVPDAPRLLGRWDNQGGYVSQVVRSGSLAILVSASDLLLYDVSDPKHPRRVGRHEGVPLYWTGGAYQLNAALGASGSRAVIAYESIPAEVLDLSDPTHPVVLGRFEPRGLVHRVALTPTHAFLGYRAPADGRSPRVSDPTSLSVRGGIQIVDLRNAAEPRVTSTLGLHQAVTDLALAGERLVTAHPDGSLTVINVHDPEGPSVLGQLAGGGTGGADVPLRNARVAISRDGLRAYLSHATLAPGADPYDGGAGTLTIVDLSSAAQPRVASRLEFRRGGGMEIPVVVSGDRVIVLLGTEGGFMTVDVSSPARPIVLARHALPPRVYAEGLAADAQYVYLGAWEDGLLIYEVPTAVRQ